jgi:hypothetical protein
MLSSIQPALLAPDPRWPRTFTKGGDTVIVYQPQIDAWKDHSKIRFRAAVAAIPGRTGEPEYGVVAAQGDTVVDHAARTVLISNADVAVRFPGLPDVQAAPLKQMVKELLPSLDFMDISLDQVLACVGNAAKVRTVDLDLRPPPIYYSDVPAVLVVYLGQPQFRPIKDTTLLFAVNTNWVVLMDAKTARYYLLDGGSWLASPDPLKGPWTAATELPAELSKLPAGAEWDGVRKHVPGVEIAGVPRVLTSTEPAELIVTVGPPDYTPIPGTMLMYVSNPDTPLFMDLATNTRYFCAAGRWFRSQDVTGPWTAASDDLPAEFAKIPADCPVGYVLASVPRTQEARDAALLAAVPHKATVKIGDAKLDVAYDGPPKFEPISGTSMTFAVNTSYEIVCADAKYYCCHQGVWFVSPEATGPWAVCTSIPAAIYTIPPSCPVYNVTYVQVYDSTPDTVVVGYTGGYYGEYAGGTGALMFGAGVATSALLAASQWSCCSPCYYSYGCCARYDYAYGGYYRGGAAFYGPHGGAGWGATYDPAAGTWSRAGYAYGAGGARWGAEAYNPFTHAFAAHAGGTRGYQSWGHTAVSHDGKWAQAGHVSGVLSKAGWAETSSDQWAAGDHIANSTVARAANRGVYAGHDGNVYRRSDDGWQKYQGNGNWGDVSVAKPYSQWQQPASDAKSEDTWRNNMQTRPQHTWANSFKSDWSSDNWKSVWDSSELGNRLSSDNWASRWGQHDTLTGLNHDFASRFHGTDNALSSWGSRLGGGGLGGGGLRGFGGGGFGGFHGRR